MFAAFAKLREIQTMRALRPVLRERLAPPDTSWSLMTLREIDLGAVRRELGELLASPAGPPMLRAGG